AVADEHVGRIGAVETGEVNQFPLGCDLGQLKGGQDLVVPDVIDLVSAVGAALRDHGGGGAGRVLSVGGEIYLADPVAVEFSEAECISRSRHDFEWTGIGGRNRKFGNLSGGRNPPDLVAVRFDKPQCAVGARDDVLRLAVRRR